MPKFTPKSERELNPLLPKGEYDAEVIKAEDTVSKGKGYEMISMTLRVWDSDGTTHLVNDWLVFCEQTLYKVLHFCEAAGLMDVYQGGELTAEDVLNKTVKIKLRVQEDQQYGDKNSVNDYVVPKKKPAESLAQTVNNSAPYPDPNAINVPDHGTPESSDIPF